MQTESSSLAHKLNVPRQLMEQAAVAAHDFLTNGMNDESIAMSRGLVALNTDNWYFRELLATALYRKGEGAEALQVIDKGLVYAPGNPKLTALRASVTAMMAARERNGFVVAAPQAPAPARDEGQDLDFRLMAFRA